MPLYTSKFNNLLKNVKLTNAVVKEFKENSDRIRQRLIVI